MTDRETSKKSGIDRKRFDQIRERYDNSKTSRHGLDLGTVSNNTNIEISTFNSRIDLWQQKINKTDNESKEIITLEKLKKNAKMKKKIIEDKIKEKNVNLSDFSNEESKMSSIDESESDIVDIEAIKKISKKIEEYDESSDEEDPFYIWN